MIQVAYKCSHFKVIHTQNCQFVVSQEDIPTLLYKNFLSLQIYTANHLKIIPFQPSIAKIFFQAIKIDVWLSIGETTTITAARSTLEKIKIDKVPMKNLQLTKNARPCITWTFLEYLNCICPLDNCFMKCLAQFIL